MGYLVSSSVIIQYPIYHNISIIGALGFATCENLGYVLGMRGSVLPRLKLDYF